ncbi:MAG: 50S ribosomal protein L13, partial [Armatimonadetes bacterium]|nr:50S ribosomal protein L13 [Armatimonadota bacterium]
MRTESAKPEDFVDRRRWYVIDAQNRPLGRVATAAAKLLRGKHRPMFTPHVDCGDHVVVINASNVALTGRKAEQEMSYRHSGHPGGLKAISLGQLRQTKPDRLVRQAVRGMLPKTSL